MNWPTIYRYEGRWWHGGMHRWDSDTAWSLTRELFWMLRHGTMRACWQWPKLVFGIGRGWYDGPFWFVHFGVFTVDLWVD